MLKCVAFDIGGTKVSSAVVDSSFNLLDYARVPVPKQRSSLANFIVSVVSNYKLKHRDINGVSISIPGFVNNKGRIVFAGGSLAFLKGFNLKSYLEKRLSLPVFLLNDANAFVLAEALFGAGKNKNIVLGIIWGSGIGSGLVVNKTLYTGAHGFASELGHVVVDNSVTSGPVCACGFRGCAESFAGGKSIVRNYKRLLGKPSLNVSTPQIMLSSDKTSRIVYNNALDALAKALFIGVNLYDPDVIVVGGGLSNLPKKVFDDLQSRLDKLLSMGLYDLAKLRVRIVKNKISDGGLLGAAIMYFDSFSVIKRKY